MPWRELYWHCNFFFDKVSHLKHPIAYISKLAATFALVHFFHDFVKHNRWSVWIVIIFVTIIIIIIIIVTIIPMIMMILIIIMSIEERLHRVDEVVKLLERHAICPPSGSQWCHQALVPTVHRRFMEIWPKYGHQLTYFPHSFLSTICHKICA